MSKVPRWRKGRRELMEDAMEGIGLGVSDNEIGKMMVKIQGLEVAVMDMDEASVLEGDVDWEEERTDEDGLIEALLAAKSASLRI